ncbi:MAG: ATP-dependent Clp protease ATP-binding subunit [Eubacterium sp.]|nr:ATP-dependent Clp protease ATP-binding subunit [Eubacterium sp.]
MKRDFTASAERALTKAGEIAAKLGTTAIGTEHLLYGLSAVSGTASRILKENGVIRQDIEMVLEDMIGGAAPEKVKRKDCDVTPRFDEIILSAEQIAERNEDSSIGTEHIFLAILKARDTGGLMVLRTLEANLQKMFVDVVLTMGADLNAAKAELSGNRSTGKKGKSETPMLDQYSRDLVEYAREGRLDPVFNRDEEIAGVIEILSRRTKNNPCMVGEPGVGKTAIAEGLAIRIAENSVPETMAGKRILSLDLSGMVAGSKYRGEFEDRIKRAVKEAISAGNIILFIDELHTVIGAGGAEGAIDASNILKPALSRGEIQVIGATTREEYRKRIEKDAALERRFQPVVIEEPTVVQTIGMLRGLRERYESFHRIKISDEALEAAAKLSDRYINDRYLPDKAIDLMDEAAAKLRLAQAVKKGQVSAELEDKIRELEQSKEKNLIKGDMELVLQIHAEEQETREELDKELKKWQKKQKKEQVLSAQQIAEVVSAWTKIPVSRLAKDETKRLQKMETILHERVVGQNEAVEAVSRAVRRGRVGLKDPKRPIGSFLFLGPTGVGKTELSKALAEAVFGSEKDMIRIDMSEYMEKQSVSKMVGSPPGYVGYEEGGQLSEKVRQKPYSVLLFDEIEKAHPDVFNMLLQILEDGHLTDSQGRRVDFKNTIIIMTSNAGANRIISPKTLGFLSSEDAEQDHKRMKEGVMEEVKHLFKPEFINRIDEIIVFHALTRENISDIASHMLESFRIRAKEQMDLTVRYGKSVVEFVAEKGFDKDYGARPLRRAIQNQIEDALAQELVNGAVKIGDTVKIAVKSGKIYVQNFIKK